MKARWDSGTSCLYYVYTKMIGYSTLGDEEVHKAMKQFAELASNSKLD